jgi:diguanylate cyclase (GGDEF)-like protein/PAS domain S-box-containing protein
VARGVGSPDRLTITARHVAFVIGACLAVALIEAIIREAWDIVALALVPLFFAGRLYGIVLRGLSSERHHRDILQSLERPVITVDTSGRVTLWNDALTRLVGSSSSQAIGRPLAHAMRALGETELPRAVDEALKHQTPRMLQDLRLTGQRGARIFSADILPDCHGATIIWHDVTDQRIADQSLKRSAERLALVGDGANDGLWAWDRRTHEFYVSSRWRTLVGLAPQSGVGRPEDWLNRVHPDDIVPLKAALDAHLAGHTDHFLHEHRIRHEDGTYRWYLCRGVASRGADHRADLIAGSLESVSELTSTRERSKNEVWCDALTGLSNRAVFLETIKRRLAHYKEHSAGRFAVLFLDLDRFKVINDSLGHLVGDELLIAVSRRLESCVRASDVLARLGGDEFAILLNSISDEMQANVLAHRIQDALTAPFSIGGREVFTSISIGIAISRFEHTNPEEILRDADTAMYHAKSRGKARHELFDADMHARALDRLGLESDLRQAVKNEVLDVHYQPIVLLTSSMCVGFEALVRWTRNGKIISPADFVPIAEELGLIEALGGWVLQKSCQTFSAWRQRYPAAPLDYITVNVSARQLMQQGFVHFVERTVYEAGMKPSDVRLEITETALMDNPREAADILHRLREFGLKIYLDDFGTGYSSLSHLHKLPVDALKIDRSFVRSLLLNDRPAIVESILALARTLETGVVAEGVESEQQARQLEHLGCRYAQGYFFSPPIAAASVEQLLKANKPLGIRKSSRPTHEPLMKKSPELAVETA